MEANALAGYHDAAALTPTLSAKSACISAFHDDRRSTRRELFAFSVNCCRDECLC